MVNWKDMCLLWSFTFIKTLFSSSLSAIRVVSSAYLRLLIFLLAVLVPACASSSPAFLLMYSACKVNKQGDNIQPWRIPFPIWNQSVVTCPVLTIASWPTYRFLKRQVRWSGIPISFRIFQFVVIHTVKGSGFWLCVQYYTKYACVYTHTNTHRISKKIYTSWAPKLLQMVTAAIKLKDACSLEEKLWPT